MIGCLQTRVHKQPIITLYFESENELKFYNLKAWLSSIAYLQKQFEKSLKSPWILLKLSCMNPVVTFLLLYYIADELKKKISESYSIFRSHVIEDLRPIRESEWNDIQQACRLVYIHVGIWMVWNNLKCFLTLKASPKICGRWQF